MVSVFLFLIVFTLCMIVLIMSAILNAIRNSAKMHFVVLEFMVKRKEELDRSHESQLRAVEGLAHATKDLGDAFIKASKERVRTYN